MQRFSNSCHRLRSLSFKFLIYFWKELSKIKITQHIWMIILNTSKLKINKINLAFQFRILRQQYGITICKFDVCKYYKNMKQGLIGPYSNYRVSGLYNIDLNFSYRKEKYITEMHFNLNRSRWISKIYKTYIWYAIFTSYQFMLRMHMRPIDALTIYIYWRNRCRVIEKAPLFLENSHSS